MLYFLRFISSFAILIKDYSSAARELESKVRTTCAMKIVAAW